MEPRERLWDPEALLTSVDIGISLLDWVVPPLSRGRKCFCGEVQERTSPWSMSRT